MRDEEEDIDEKAEQTRQEVDDADNKDDKEISGRVRGRVEVRDNSEDEHDQRQERRDGVDNQDRGEGRSCSRGEGEVGGLIDRKAWISQNN